MKSLNIKPKLLVSPLRWYYSCVANKKPEKQQEHNDKQEYTNRV